MTPREYHQFIMALQREEYPGMTDEKEHMKDDDGTNIFFAPSHHFRPHTPLLTEAIVADLRDNGKKLLSIGCGPAYLERLLVSRLGVGRESITLADISKEQIPEGFRSFIFDMHQDWPDLGRAFDYVIFPESALINLNFYGEMTFEGDTIRQKNREEGLYRVLARALGALNSPGQARLTSGVPGFVKIHVKPRIEADFPNTRMEYAGELTYVVKMLGI